MDKEYQIKLDIGAKCNVLPLKIVKKTNAEILPSITKRLIS